MLFDKLKNKKYLSVKTKITIVFSLFMFVVLFLVFLFFYINAKNIYKENLRNHLLSIAEISSLQINGDEHNLLQSIEDEQSLEYKKLIQILKKIQEKVPEIYYIYTMRENDKGQITFILDPDDVDPNDISHIGTLYMDASPFLKDNFSSLDYSFAEEDFYTDEWGTWLSAYAPFYDSNGVRSGILGIDIDASDIIAKEKKLLTIYILIFSLLLILSIFLGLFVGSRIVKSVTSLTKILKDAEKNKGSIENFSNDEIGELANILNLTINKASVSQKENEQIITDKIKILERTNKLMMGRELEMIKLKKEIEILKNKINSL